MSKYKIVSGEATKKKPPVKIHLHMGQKGQEILKNAGSFLISLLIPVLVFLLSESMNHNPFSGMNSTAHPFNILIYEALFLLLFFLTGKVRIALPIETLLFAVFSLANYYVMEFRTNPIVPWDIYSIKTATSVAGNYSYALPAGIILRLFGFLALTVIGALIPLRFPKKTFRYRILPALLCFGILFCFYEKLGDESFRAKHHIYDKQFTPLSMYKKEGLALNFLMNLHFVFVDVPSGYDKAEVEALLTEANLREQEEISSYTGNYPNIVVIMNEAFSDLTVLGDMPVNEDPIPFVHAMLSGADNTVSGLLNVSVVGGNTANTEYEFLTGNTMAFLPNGSIPYQQYVKGEVSGLCAHLDQLGYATVAMHPYRPGGWMRNSVYPAMGFQEMYFEQDFKDTHILRKYVDDESDLANVLRVLKNKEQGQPMFIFNVTMQNHSSYSDTYEDLPLTIKMDGDNSISLSTYLTLLKKSDEALEGFLSEIASMEEETIVVFFGDHQPAASVVSPIFKHNGISSKELSDEEENRRYQVPFLIWANYDIEEKQGEETSANYLAAHVLKTAGLPLADYQLLMQNIEEEIPVLTAIRRKDAGADTDEAYKTYEKLQYYRIFH